MIQDLDNSIYDNSYHDYKIRDIDRVIICNERTVLLKNINGKIEFPTIREFKSFSEYTYLFSINNIRYFTVSNAVISDASYTYENIEIFRTALPKEERFAGITGFQLCSWYNSHKYCSRCGNGLIHDIHERMLRCPECNMTNYPTISPAIIVAIVNGDKLLITKYAGRNYKKYALVAGFAEIGETLEETVKREVYEEVSLKVKDIKYYGCQPWSFTSSLLIGFFAKVDGDTNITIDGEELSEGRWIDRKDMNDIEDDGITLTREMMIAFKEGKFKF